jgi:hypothetical protein
LIAETGIRLALSISKINGQKIDLCGVEAGY